MYYLKFYIVKFHFFFNWIFINIYNYNLLISGIIIVNIYRNFYSSKKERINLKVIFGKIFG